MARRTNRFLERPATMAGWWSVAAGTFFTILFLLVSNNVVHFPGRLTIFLGVLSGILTLAALIWKKERSWMVWLVLLPGMFAVLFALGEILSPH